MNIFRNVVYDRINKDFCCGDWFIPDSPAPAGGYPAVLNIHGGGWGAMQKEDVEGIALLLARNGFAVFNINYRLAPQVNIAEIISDCQHALQYMFAQQEYSLNREFIAVSGASAGGHLALFTALSGIAPVAAVAAISPIADVFADYELHKERYRMIFGHQPATEELVSINPGDIENFPAIPVCCTHYRYDEVVPVKSLLDFEQKFTARDGEIQTYIYDFQRYGQGHGIWRNQDFPKLLYEDIETVITSFLKQHYQQQCR